ADALREQRMVLAQVGADDQRALQRRQAGDRGAQPARRTGGRQIGEIGMTQTAVDVLAAQAAHQRTGQGQLFHRAVRAGQHADGAGAMVGLDLPETVGHVFEGGLPVDRLPFAALLDHGLRQALVAAQRLVREAVAVGDPAFVDGLVFQRYHAHDALVLDLHDQVGPRGVVRTHALAARELPGAGAVAEGLAGERADRADVDHVAREFGVHRLADEGFDLGMLAAVGHAQFHDTGDLLAEAHATGAVDAAAHFLHGNQRSRVLVEHDALFFLVTRGTGTIAHGQVLQLALT